MHKFVRLASRYEEETLGWTTIGYPSKTPTDKQLGSGYTFANEAAKTKEMAFNASRIEGWRRTRSYEYWKEVRIPSLRINLTSGLAMLRNCLSEIGLPWHPADQNDQRHRLALSAFTSKIRSVDDRGGGDLPIQSAGGACSGPGRRGWYLGLLNVT